MIIIINLCFFYILSNHYLFKNFKIELCLSFLQVLPFSVPSNAPISSNSHSFLWLSLLRIYMHKYIKASCWVCSVLLLCIRFRGLSLVLGGSSLREPNSPFLSRHQLLVVLCLAAVCVRFRFPTSASVSIVAVWVLFRQPYYGSIMIGICAIDILGSEDHQLLSQLFNTI